MWRRLPPASTASGRRARPPCAAWPTRRRPTTRRASGGRGPRSTSSWGGYPALEPLPPEDRRTWLRDFRRTYLERDLADLGRVADLDQFALAQNLLAARTARILSYSEVARDLGVAVNTVKRYARFLEISYPVVLLRPLVTLRPRSFRRWR